MFISLFNTLRATGVPCSLRELLDLIAAVDKRLAFSDMEQFYFLSRAILVKDEKRKEKKTESPASKEIISSADIRRTNTTNLGGYLKGLKGVDFTWTLFNMFFPMLLTSSIVLILFYIYLIYY